MTFGIYNWAELIAALVCTGCFISSPTRLNRLFLPFLWLVFFVEITGKLTTSLPIIKTILYNVFNGVQFCFYFYFLYTIQENGPLRSAIPKITLLFIGFYIFNFFFAQGFNIFNSYTRLAGTAILVSLCLISIWNISFNYERGTPHYFPALIMICGIIVFFAVNIANESFYNYMIEKDPNGALKLYKGINHNLNIVLYGCISGAFLFEVYKQKPYSN